MTEDPEGACEQIDIREAAPHEMPLVRSLFTEYAAGLGFDLCFQGFDRELDSLPGEYAAPEGVLLLAWQGAGPIGCVALRRFAAGLCEMKRLYVRPASRGQGVGRHLAEAVIDHARRLRYRWIRLDTTPGMTEAVALYRSLGFVEIDPYRHNPLGGALFFQLDLWAARR